jgi:hypothetical protein
MDAHLLVSQLKELANELKEVPSQVEFLHRFSLTRWQVEKHGGWHRLCEMAGVSPRGGRNQHSKKPHIEPRAPVICYLDEEISDMTVRTYSLKTDYIPHKNIVKNWHFYSWAAMFEHEPEKIYYLDQRYAPDITDDRQLIEGLHHIISSADVLSGHCIKRFDMKKFTTRAALYGLDPIPLKVIWDTYPLYKKYFDLPSYSLGFICKYFGFKNQKVDHSGDMWKRCEQGELAAWEENEFYNKGDIKCSREALHFIARFEPSINLQSFHQKPTCLCGSQEFYRDGETSTKQGIFAVYRCHQCKAPYSGKENLIDKDLRKGFFK